MSVCVRTFVVVRARVCVCLRACMCECVRMGVCVHACACVRVSVWMCACVISANAFTLHYEITPEYLRTRTRCVDKRLGMSVTRRKISWLFSCRTGAVLDSTYLLSVELRPINRST